MDNNLNQVPCEHLKTCGFFLKFSGNTEVVKSGWVKMYCDSKEKSLNCARKKIREKTGVAPEPAMAPSGKILIQIVE